MIASGYDKSGKRFVDCSECERGGNGTDPEKCSAGWQHTKPHQGYCYLGVPIESVQKILEKQRGQ